MKRFFLALSLLLASATSAAAFTEDTGTFEGLDFIADTEIAGPNGTTMSLCYVTRDFRILGLTLTRNVQSYALSSDGCNERLDRAFTREQIETAQALGIVDPSLPSQASNSIVRIIQNYGLWAALGLGMIAIIIRRLKSLLGMDPNGPLRKKAAQRILIAMCYAGKCDGVVAAKEISVIERTAQRLTRRPAPPADIMRITDAIELDLTPEDYVDFGRGLRDSEKDILMQAVFYVVMATDRILPAEHEFLSNLAFGLGIPGEDFRRLMDAALADLDQYPADQPLAA